MARIRTIKPEFWTDSTVVALPIETRLFYIGMWNFAQCDAGHLPDDPGALKLKIFPADPVDPVALVQQLVDAGRIARLVVEGRPFLHIQRFADHQKLDSRWAPRCAVCKSITETPPNSREFERARVSSPKLPEGKDLGDSKDSREGTGTAPPRRCVQHLNDPVAPPCMACRDARLAREDWDKAQKAIPTPHAPRAEDVKGRFCHVDGHGGYPVPCEKCQREEEQSA